MYIINPKIPTTEKQRLELKGLEIWRGVTPCSGVGNSMDVGFMQPICKMKTIGGTLGIGSRTTTTYLRGYIVANLTTTTGAKSSAKYLGATTKNRGKGRSKNSSRSSCLINMTPNKKGNNSEKTGGPSATPESKQGQEKSTSLMKETDTSKVDQKSSKTIMSAKDFSFHLPSVSSTCPQSKQEVPSKEKEETEVKLEDSPTSEDPPSKTAPLSPVHAPSMTAEGLPATVKEEPVVLEAIPPKDDYSHVGSPPAVEIPFLSETTNDNHSEGKEDIELNQITSSLKDEDLPSTLSDVHVVPVLVREKKYEKTQITSSLKDEDLYQSSAVLATSSSNLPSTLSDVRVVPVLVREKKYEKAENVWAPEDRQAPPCNVNEVGKCHRVSEHDSDLVLSESPPHSLISCDQKSDTERWLEYCSSSPKNQHSSDSRHSSAIRTSRELRSQRSRSPHRRERSRGSSDRSPCLQKGQHSSDSQHPRASHASRELRIHRSRSPHKRERSHGSSNLSPCRREHSSFCHCGYCYNPHRKNLYERDSPPSYLVQKRSHRYSPEERSELYEAPHSYNRESPREKLKKKISSSRKTEKKKKATAISEKARKSTKTKKKTKGDQAGGTPVSSETAQKLQPVETELPDPIQAATCSEDADPTHPLCAGEKDGFSSSSRTSEDRSAAVLARKEEIEQAYQRVLLNFAVVTAMLLETKPCMEEAMEAALRANLRRIGNYYECMLKDFIDSYDLANAI
ncbi:Hypothetical predicted protein [Podarcis lilfordi]|uniref:Periphilin-1 C-terminal domain-containing protein n=1 Tax=Podarcis lilfordi TaxID=74358 RepID=A0AA35KFY9_9SAUR|nr:Hypothetical predicted protein [Podarcis lilfordi]